MKNIMHIEDLIILSAIRIKTNPFDQKILSSFVGQLNNGISFTEKQGDLALKIIKRQKLKIESIINQKIDHFIENPSFRLGKRKSIQEKRLKIEDDDRYIKTVHAIFPYSEEIIKFIKENKPNLENVFWDNETKSWVFPLVEKNLVFLKDFSRKFDFETEEILETFFNEIEKIQSSIENFIPTIDFIENSFSFLNVPKNVEQPTGNDLIEALFLGRKQGIHVWSEKISKKIEEEKVSKQIINFLDTPPIENFSFYIEESPFQEIKGLIKHLFPALFIIPGGTEQEKIEMCRNLLQEMGLTESEMSVLFRLPNETNEKFNKFIKESKLNNPIDEKTKVVFISAKIPKTIINTIEFNCIVNFNFYNVHYTIRELVKTHHNVINIFEKQNQGTFNFASM